MPKVDFDPLELVEEIAAEHAGIAEQKGLQMASFCSPELPRVLHDNREEIKRALMGLTEYALACTERGSVIVEALFSATPEEEIVRYAVTDSISNVTQEEVDQLKHKILCPGETTCASLLHTLDTKLYAESMEGRGTRFLFPLKVVRGEGRPVDENFPDAFSKARIFVVANDPPANRYIQNYLRYAGFEIDGAPTANESLLEFGRRGLVRPYDIIAICPPIEDMDPFELAEQVRSSQLRDTKLLFVASFKKEIREGRSTFDYAISKPFTRQGLYDAVARLLDVPDTYAMKSGKPLALVVEDNLINQKILMFQLRQLGYEADCVANGQEAVDASKKTNYAAILMDLMMPVMDGVQATREIRKVANGRRVPIIAVSANDSRREEALAAGMETFLTKPVSLDQLRRALEKFVRVQTRG